MVPKYKSAKKSIRENYRPIPVLSVSSKLIELVVQERLYNIMDKNELFCSSQFGFRSKLSPIHALPDTIPWEMVGDNSNVIFFSYFAWFTKNLWCVQTWCVRTKKTMCEPEGYGVIGVCLHYFISYLIERSQCVSVFQKIDSLQGITFWLWCSSRIYFRTTAFCYLR